LEFVIHYSLCRLSNNDQNFDRCLDQCDTTISALRQHSSSLDNKKYEKDNIIAQQKSEVEKTLRLNEVLLQNKQVFSFICTMQEYVIVIIQ